MTGLESHPAWHFLIDADDVLAVIALDNEDSLLSFQSGGYEYIDRMVKPFVPSLRLLHSDFKGKWKRPAREIVAVHYREGSAGYQ
ncbi:hypothetical protein AAur_pTC20186 (plasmid) [Paenarthrobacter aurescens TC1]|uniref:Uncharacterized protein n=1 Tax=Paenarthrobacter aurescens (strain TC1) TaxID=290340 RepID=A1RDM5_PAEAT|nr:hypothetical protein AAur_pTC20186 [Paenarthrobacter aurescens TC1]